MCIGLRFENEYRISTIQQVIAHPERKIHLKEQGRYFGVLNCNSQRDKIRERTKSKEKHHGFEAGDFIQGAFIHSFILNISIAPLQKAYSVAIPTPARLKRAVFR